MKYWIYRSEVSRNLDISTEHFLEQHPDKAYIHTKLYFLYDKPMYKPIDTARSIELPNYWYEDIKPDQLVEFDSNKGKRHEHISNKVNDYAQVILIGEDHGKSDIHWDAKDLSEARRLLKLGLDYLNNLIYNPTHN